MHGHRSNHHYNSNTVNVWRQKKKEENSHWRKRALYSMYLILSRQLNSLLSPWILQSCYFAILNRLKITFDKNLHKISFKKFAGGKNRSVQWAFMLVLLISSWFGHTYPKYVKDRKTLYRQCSYVTKKLITCKEGWEHQISYPLPPPPFEDLSREINFSGFAGRIRQLKGKLCFLHL